MIPVAVVLTLSALVVAWLVYLSRVDATARRERRGFEVAVLLVKVPARRKKKGKAMLANSAIRGRLAPSGLAC
jgi:hypothetical protein